MSLYIFFHRLYQYHFICYKHQHYYYTQYHSINAKEFDDTGKNLLFEGEYFNSNKWNGKGVKIYDKYNDLYFDGEIKNGRIWEGKAIENSNCRKPVFQYEFRNGIKISSQKRNVKDKILYEIKYDGQKVKENSRNNNLAFIGTYINGLKCGEGVEFYQSSKKNMKDHFSMIKDMDVERKIVLMVLQDLKVNLDMVPNMDISRFLNLIV